MVAGLPHRGRPAWHGGLPRHATPLRVVGLQACAWLDEPYTREVVAWLEETRVPWRRLDDAGPIPILALGGDALAVRLLPTPWSASDVRPTWEAAALTDTLALRGEPTLVHLHEDVWRSRGPIVRSRLLVRTGRLASRLYARSCVARRIGAEEYMPFLDANHLWGSTRAKYGYGLHFEGELVAVATFSSRRRIVRAGVPHQSHELLRVCSRPAQHARATRLRAIFAPSPHHLHLRTGARVGPRPRRRRAPACLAASALSLSAAQARRRSGGRHHQTGPSILPRTRRG